MDCPSARTSSDDTHRTALGRRAVRHRIRPPHHAQLVFIGCVTRLLRSPNPEIPKSLFPHLDSRLGLAGRRRHVVQRGGGRLVRQPRHLSPKTLDGNRSVAWSLFRFLGADLSLTALKKLHPTLAAEWLGWLRANPPTQAKAWSLPKTFSRESVAEFLKHCDATPEMAGKTRRRQLDRRPLFAGRRQPTLQVAGPDGPPPKKDLPRPRRLPPMVPTIDELAARWREILNGQYGEATASQRRRVVLTQGFLLLTGLRKQEALLVEQNGLEDSFLLVPGGITKPRVPKMICLNGQALGIAAALRGQLTFGFAEGKRHRLLGWPYTPGHWDHLVAKCGPAAWKFQQQSLRQRCDLHVLTR